MDKIICAHARKKTCNGYDGDDDDDDDDVIADFSHMNFEFISC